MVRQFVNLRARISRASASISLRRLLRSGWARSPSKPSQGSAVLRVALPNAWRYRLCLRRGVAVLANASVRQSCVILCQPVGDTGCLSACGFMFASVGRRPASACGTFYAASGRGVPSTQGSAVLLALPMSVTGQPASACQRLGIKIYVCPNAVALARRCA